MPELQVPKGISVNRQRVATPQVNVSVTPEQLAGPEVRLLTELGKKADEVTDFVIRKQNAVDLAVVTQAESAMQQVLMERKLAANELRGSQTKDLLKNGEQFIDGNLNAVEGEVISPKHRKTLDSYQRLYGALDERQQQAVDQLRMKKRLSFLTTLGAHETAETDKAGIAGAEASIITSTAAANANVYDDAQRRESIETIRKSSAAIALINGEKKVVTDERSATAISTIHENAIKTYIAKGDVETATEYLREHRKAITGDVSALQKAIKTRADDGKALEIAKDAYKLETPNEQLNAVLNKTDDPGVVKTAMSYLTTFQAQTENQKKADVAKADSEIFNAIWGEDSPAYINLNQDSLALLPPKTREVYRKMIIARDTTWPVVEAQDNAIAMGTLLKFADEHPNEFVNNYKLPTEYWGRLDKESFNKMVALQKKMKDELGKGDSDSTTGLVTDKIATLGWSSAKYAAHAGQFRIDAGDLKSTMTKEKGRPPTRAEFKEGLESLASTAYREKQQKTYFQHDPTGDPKDPRTLANQLKSSFKAAGWLNVDKAAKPEAAVKMGRVELAVEKAMADHINNPQNTYKIPMNADQRRRTIDRIMKDKVYVRNETNWIGYTPSPELKLASESDDEPGRFVKFTDEDGEEREIPVSTIDNLPASQKREIGRKITTEGLALTYENKAKAYIQLELSPPASTFKKSPPSSMRGDIIINPSGKKEISLTELRDMFSNPDISYEELATPGEIKDFKNQYGDNAWAVYMQLLANKKAD